MQDLTDLDFRFHAERTPNPNSIKWVLGQPMAPVGVAAQFSGPVEPEVSPLANALFEVDGIVSLLISGNLVTVTKREECAWDVLAEPITAALKSFGASGLSALGPAYVEPERSAESEVVQRIQEILENEVRPAIAMDGGDVQFVDFEAGTVRVLLQGACVGCPSSTATLRFGIEGRLREVIPEVERVVSV